MRSLKRGAKLLRSRHPTAGLFKETCCLTSQPPVTHAGVTGNRPLGQALGHDRREKTAHGLQSDLPSDTDHRAISLKLELIRPLHASF